MQHCNAFFDSPPGVLQFVKLAKPRSVTRQRNMSKLAFYSVFNVKSFQFFSVRALIVVLLFHCLFVTYLWTGHGGALPL